MWIKNCFVYRIRDPEWIERMATEPDLQAGLFSDCLPTQPVSLGLVPPESGLDALQYTASDLIVWRFQRQERLLPASVVRETVDARAAERQDNDQRRIGRNERQRIQDEVRLELLPRAFTRNQFHRILIHRGSGWLLVESGSETRADELTGALRDCLGELPIVPLSALCRPEPAWTQWLLEANAGGDIRLLDEYVLAHPEEDSTVRLKRVPGDSHEVSQLLETGYRPQQVHFDWNETFTGLMDQRSVLSRLRFSDELRDQVDHETGSDDSHYAEWAATHHLMAAALGQFLDDYERRTAVDSASEPTS